MRFLLPQMYIVTFLSNCMPLRCSIFYITPRYI